MLKLRRIGTLVRALTVGVVTTSSVVVAATALVGCADENDPSTHVKRLNDAVKRTAAVERLIQMYNDKMTVDQRNREGENVKPLLDKIVPPLADLAEKGELDQKTQGKLLAMLADTRDKRAIKALVKAIDSYKPDDKRPEEFDANINDVVRNLGEMKAAGVSEVSEASDALFKLFQNLHNSWRKAGPDNHNFAVTVQDALVAIADPKWEDALIKMLEVPIKTLSNKETATLSDQMYWQNVAALLLGDMRSQKAVPALLKVIITPFKGAAGGTAMSALIKIGKPSADAAVKLLAGQDPDLQKYAEDEFLRAAEDKGDKIDDNKKKDAKKAYSDNAVVILSNLGRAEGLGPMLTQIDKGDETSDAIVASKLSMLPADPKATAAFKKVWEDTKLSTSLPGSEFTAKEALTEMAGNFLDQDLATYVAKGALDMKPKGDNETEADVGSVQERALVMLLKLAGPKQLDLLDQLGAKKSNEDVAAAAPAKDDKKDKDKKDKPKEPEKPKEKPSLAKAYEKEFKIVKEMVGACKEDGKCYLAKLKDPQAQKDSGFFGIKAAYMAAIYGGEAIRGDLVSIREQSTNPATAFTIELMIDRLSPKGDKDAVDKLQKLIDRALASKDVDRIRMVSNLKTVVGRLRCRMQ